MATDFTNEELLAYTEERLPIDRAAVLESEVRKSTELLTRLTQVIQTSDRGDLTLGGMWRRGRWSCPPRAVWMAYLDERLGDGLSQYLRFHVETIGCRICLANLTDLKTGDRSTDDRVRKIFQSSVGGLKPKG